VPCGSCFSDCLRGTRALRTPVKTIHQRLASTTPATNEGKHYWFRYTGISHFLGDILFPVFWCVSPFMDTFMKFFSFQNGGKKKR
jgi:hypothetical protein